MYIQKKGTAHSSTLQESFGELLAFYTRKIHILEFNYRYDHVRKVSDPKGGLFTYKMSGTIFVVKNPALHSNSQALRKILIWLRKIKASMDPYEGTVRHNTGTPPLYCYIL